MTIKSQLDMRNVQKSFLSQRFIVKCGKVNVTLGMEIKKFFMLVLHKTIHLRFFVYSTSSQLHLLLFFVPLNLRIVISTLHNFKLECCSSWNLKHVSKFKTVTKFSTILNNGKSIGVENFLRFIWMLIHTKINKYKIKCTETSI